MLSRHCLPLGLLLMVAACTATQPPPSAATPATDPLTASQRTAGGVETLERILHPAGPSLRREWRQDASSPVSRVHITNARSGQWLIGQARLQRLSYGTWQIGTGAGTAQRLDTRPHAGPQAFVEDGRKWTLHVEKEFVPTVQAGVATEGEPVLNLLIEQH